MVISAPAVASGESWGLFLGAEAPDVTRPLGTPFSLPTTERAGSLVLGI